MRVYRQVYKTHTSIGAYVHIIYKSYAITKTKLKVNKY